MPETRIRIALLLIIVAFASGRWCGERAVTRDDVAPRQAKIDNYEALIKLSNAVSAGTISEDGFALDYGKFQNLPVRLLITSKGVDLQVYAKEYVFGVDSQYHEYLKREVETLYRSPDGVKLPSGITIKLEGFPVWAPYESHAVVYYAECLGFGRRVTFKGSTMIVHGLPEKPDYYYPYTLGSSF